MNKIIVFLIFIAASLIEANAIEIITALKIYRDSPFNLSSDEKVKYGVIIFIAKIQNIMKK